MLKNVYHIILSCGCPPQCSRRLQASRYWWGLRRRWLWAGQCLQEPMANLPASPCTHGYWRGEAGSETPPRRSFPPHRCTTRCQSWGRGKLMNSGSQHSPKLVRDRVHKLCTLLFPIKVSLHSKNEILNKYYLLTCNYFLFCSNYLADLYKKLLFLLFIFLILWLFNMYYPLLCQLHLFVANVIFPFHITFQLLKNIPYSLCNVNSSGYFYTPNMYISLKHYLQVSIIIQMQYED